MRRLCLLTPCAIVLLAVAVIGCGDDDSPTTPPTPEQFEWQVPADVPTIAVAADSAQQGEAIVLAPGTYLEYGIVLDVGVDLRGESSKAGDVVIDGQGLGRVLLVEHGEETVVQPGDTTTVIENLVIRNGLGDAKGGGGLLTSLRTELRRVRLARNTATGPGGAVRANHCDLLLSFCDLDSNAALGDFTQGGGLAVVGDGSNEVRADSCRFYRNSATTWGGGAHVSLAALHVTDCMFVFNESEGEASGGGGLNYLHTDRPASVIEGCVFANNVAGGIGGGLVCLSPVTIEGCTFSSNSALQGGGARLNHDSTVTGCFFADNRAVTVGGNPNSGFGGAIFMWAEGMIIDNCSFQTNRGSHGSALFSTGPATVSDCSFEGNVASFSGAVYWVGNTFATMRECSFTYNSAESGGAFALDGGVAAEFRHCVFDANSAATGGVGRITNATVRMDTCTVTRNAATDFGGVFRMASFSVDGPASLALQGCGITGNSAGISGGVVFMEFDTDLTAFDCDMTGNAAPEAPVGFVGGDSEATFMCCGVIPGDFYAIGSLTIDDEGCD